MRSQDFRFGLISIVVLLVLLGGVAPAEADGGETGKKADSEAPVSPIYRAASAKKQKDDQSVVITNEDLERMMAGLTPEQKLQGVYQAKRHVGAPAGESAQGKPEPGQKPEQAPENSLEWMQQQEEAAKERQSERSDVEKQVTELSAKVADLERRLLALKNPLLTRRYSTREDEEVEDWKDLDNLERVETTQKQLEEARAELAQARAKLNGGRSTPR